MGFRRLSALTLALLAWPLCVSRSTLLRAAPALPLRSLQYGTAPQQLGDLYLCDQPRGLVVLLHGGFWLPQYGKDLMSKLASDLVGRGLAVWNVEYRKIGEPGWKDFRSTLEDVALSLQYVGSSKFPLQGLPIALVGHSAGGHLALWSQLSGTVAPVAPVAVAVSCGGVLDFLEADEQGLGGGAGAVARYLGFQEISSLKHEVSPIDMLPPCLVNSLPPELAKLGTVPKCRLGLVHGKLDDVVPCEQSIRFLVSSTCAGVPCELHLLEDEGHYEVLDPRSRSWRSVLAMVETGLVEGPAARGVLHTTRLQEGKTVIFRSSPKDQAADAGKAA